MSTCTLDHTKDEDNTSKPCVIRFTKVKVIRQGRDIVKLRKNRGMRPTAVTCFVVIAF